MLDLEPTVIEASDGRWANAGGWVRNLLASRVARVVGACIGVATFALLCVSFARAAQRGADSMAILTPASVALAMCGFAAFHSLAIISLGLLGAERPQRLWAAAQLAKYLPAPGASFAAMVHTSISGGAAAKDAVGLTARHAGLVLAGAFVGGSAAAGWLVHERFGWWGWPAVMAALLVGAVLITTVTARMGTFRRIQAGVAAALGWSALGLFLGFGFGHSLTAVLTIAAAFPAAWAVGFVALPIPAGVGVREAVLVVLLTPTLGHAGALAFAILSRLLQIASDGAVAVGVFGVHPVSVAIRVRSDR